MGLKQINIRVDEEKDLPGIEARAKAAGMSVTEYVTTLATDAGNDLRHRFLQAGAHFADAWAEDFAEQFGRPPAKDTGRDDVNAA
ncbi:hypothetical protein [Streptomyces sp. HPF1205]|uniref:hypothetical protein n=1 Tax=Streptomyces sp. HPF1205 TaxID=2873262 RepID=UPI001CECC98B|nr:hypothetical protein [Streptomyces sp. HPF1205]